MEYKNKTLSNKLALIEKEYKERGKIKVLTDEKSTNGGGKSFRIRVSSYDIRYRKKEDRNKDVEKLLSFIWSIHDDKNIQNAGLIK